MPPLRSVGDARPVAPVVVASPKLLLDGPPVSDALRRRRGPHSLPAADPRQDPTAGAGGGAELRAAALLELREQRLDRQRARRREVDIVRVRAGVPSLRPRSSPAAFCRKRVSRAGAVTASPSSNSSSTGRAPRAPRLPRLPSPLAPSPALDGSSAPDEARYLRERHQGCDAEDDAAAGELAKGVVVACRRRLVLAHESEAE